jgi:hypothetical protein
MVEVTIPYRPILALSLPPAQAKKIFKIRDLAG